MCKPITHELEPIADYLIETDDMPSSQEIHDAFDEVEGVECWCYGAGCNQCRATGGTGQLTSWAATRGN